mgnify:CR=1 FL=1
MHLVLDNHSAHHTKLVQQTCYDLNIEMHFIPPYTPEFNCIEALWGWIKRDVKKRMLEFKLVTLQQLQFQNIL